MSSHSPPLTTVQRMAGCLGTEEVHNKALYVLSAQYNSVAAEIFVLFSLIACRGKELASLVQQCTVFCLK